MWRTVASNMENYRNYPRIVGETGGKDFIVAHPSADLDSLAAAIVRGSFEYQGQKCSASSRVYAPSNLWPELRERLQQEVASITMGDPADFGNFMGAVIDGASFKTQVEAIEEAKATKGADIVVGGGYDDSTGYFVEPTVIETTDPDFRLDMASANASVGITVPWRLSLSASSNASIGTSNTGRSSLRARATFPPAALISMSTASHCCITASRAIFTCCSSSTSATSAVASPPSRRISSALASASSARLPSTTILAPAAASPEANAPPRTP
jgi:hypothetical protein